MLTMRVQNRLGIIAAIDAVDGGVRPFGQESEVRTDGRIGRASLDDYEAH